MLQGSRDGLNALTGFCISNFHELLKNILTRIRDSMLIDKAQSKKEGVYI